MIQTTIKQTINVLGIDLDIDFDINYSIENSGIGGYEYMGFSGYDKGYDYPDIQTVSWDESLYDTWQNTEIKRLSKTSDFDESIYKKIKI
jgi:hypothetical protein